MDEWDRADRLAKDAIRKAVVGIEANVPLLMLDQYIICFLEELEKAYLTDRSDDLEREAFHDALSTVAEEIADRLRRGKW